MEEMEKVLMLREKKLIQLKKEAEEALKNVPKGYLRVSNHGNRTQYYHRVEPDDTSGIYIRAEDYDIVHKLAQKEYNQKILRSVNKEISAIRRYFVSCPKVKAEQIFEKLHAAKQKFILPICETEEQYIRNWEAVSYKGKGFEDNMPELYTIKKERVRSKSELIIANLLCNEAIPYRYEYPVYLKGMGQVYPDFTVLNVKKRTEFYWEHFGMMDDPSYAERAVEKIMMYEQNGIYPGEKLIITCETRKNPLNQKVLMNMISRYLR